MNEHPVEHAAAPEENAGEPALAFPINQQLLEDATRCKEEWRVVRDRLAKIEEHKEQVSPLVYERVRTDYRARIKIVTDAVLKKKREVDQEMATLQESRGTIVKELEQHRHILEEIKFRKTLGEFSEEDYQSRAREAQEKISKFETVLTAVNTNIHRYEAIFEDEPGLFTPLEAPEPQPEAPEVSEHTPAPHEIEPITDESGYVLESEGPDYFSTPDVDKTRPNLDLESSDTFKGAPDLDEIAEGTPATPRARIVIINGDDAGAAYPIKGTISFGRAESNTVTIRDAKISRQHAQIQQQGNEYIVIDLNSSNGTFVNGERIEEHVLANGDEIRVGDCVMQFQN